MIPSTWQAIVALLFGVIFAVGGFVMWLMVMQRKRMIADTPTRKVAGIALGPNELAGMATSKNSTIAPHSDTECVWWKAEYFEYRKRNANDQYHWVKVDERSGGPRYFEYADDTGSVWVRAKGAQITGKKSYEGSYLHKGRRAADTMSSVAGASSDMFSMAVSSRTAGAGMGMGARKTKVIETVLQVDRPLYLFGTAVLEPNAYVPSIIDDPEGDTPFILYAGTENQLMTRERITSAIAVVFAVLATIVVGVVPSSGDALVNQEITWSEVSFVPAIGLLMVLAMGMLVAFVASAYNGLVKLTHSVESAWSLIDVELRRRHDLIPQLVATVAGTASLELGCQAEVAALRSSISPDLPSKPDDDAVRTIGPQIDQETNAVHHLIARVEAYPELRTNDAFMGLQGQLVETESRIEMARHFYNNSVESLRTRSQVLPGAAIAWAFELDVEAEFAEENEPAAPTKPPIPEPVS